MDDRKNHYPEEYPDVTELQLAAQALAAVTPSKRGQALQDRARKRIPKRPPSNVTPPKKVRKKVKR